MGAGDMPGVLLSAHLDSDHLELEALDTIHCVDDEIIHEGPIGLDDKTGVCIVLHVLDQLLQR